MVVPPAGAQLTADLAARVKRGRVHIDVSDARTDGSDHLGEFAGRDLLRRGAGVYRLAIEMERGARFSSNATNSKA